MLIQKKLPTNKLCRLSSFLQHASEEFENVATYIRDKEIRMSIRSVALTTKQYTNELNSQLQSLRLKCNIRGVNNEVINNAYVRSNFTDKKIIELCCKSEDYFEKAYRSILNEYFPHTGLRDILMYQLNGIKCTFMQLKLLN